MWNNLRINAIDSITVLVGAQLQHLPFWFPAESISLSCLKSWLLQNTDEQNHCLSDIGCCKILSLKITKWCLLNSWKKQCSQTASAGIGESQEQFGIIEGMTYALLWGISKTGVWEYLEHLRKTWDDIMIRTQYLFVFPDIIKEYMVGGYVPFMYLGKAFRCYLSQV